LGTDPSKIAFSSAYAGIRGLSASACAEPHGSSEYALQCVWYDLLFRLEDLTTTAGHRLRIVSPGWWNHGPGPDFRGAQIEFNGTVFSGDVEIHLEMSGWRAHGHYLDERYNQVILHVVLDPARDAQETIVNAEGRGIPTLALRPYLLEDFAELANAFDRDDQALESLGAHGLCSELLPQQGQGPLLNFLRLAGEWRMLQKARALREQADRVGLDQAIYEGVLYACGYSHFKHHFRSIARALPYQRAQQLALKDPMLLEAAMLHLAGLLPDELPEGTSAVPHFARLRGHRRDVLPTLQRLPITWRRAGVRPTNYPERRMAGAALFIARTAQTGLAEGLIELWHRNEKPMALRKAFEGLFPNALGFWGKHCTWTGKTMRTPTAPIGPGRIRSIIGNIFIPAALAVARQKRDRSFEERIFDFLDQLPGEEDNRVLAVMLPRIFGVQAPPRLNFHLQQGILQMHLDWCEPNPSCRNCNMPRYLEQPIKTDTYR